VLKALTVEAESSNLSPRHIVYLLNAALIRMLPDKDHDEKVTKLLAIRHDIVADNGLIAAGQPHFDLRVWSSS
jgi:hypothetical protein